MGRSYCRGGPQNILPPIDAVHRAACIVPYIPSAAFSMYFLLYAAPACLQADGRHRHQQMYMVAPYMLCQNLYFIALTDDTDRLPRLQGDLSCYHQYTGA